MRTYACTYRNKAVAREHTGGDGYELRLPVLADHIPCLLRQDRTNRGGEVIVEDTTSLGLDQTEVKRPPTNKEPRSRQPAHQRSGSGSVSRTADLSFRVFGRLTLDAGPPRQPLDHPAGREHLL